MPTRESLKIFVDAYLLNKEHQGSKTYIKELYKALAKKYSSIQIVFGIHRDEDLVSEFSSYPNISFRYFKSNNRFSRMVFEIPNILREERFDFAHFQYILPARKNIKTKYLLTIHDVLFIDYPSYFSWFFRVSRTFLFKWSAQKADHLITVSEYSKNKIKSHFKIKKHIWVTPNGISDHYLVPFEKNNSKAYVLKKYGIKNYVLYVSRIEPRKNHHGLLEAFLRLQSSVYQLVFIGSKTSKNLHLEHLMSSLSEHQREQIHIIDQVDDEELRYFYNAAELFVYPSLVEGFGIPPLEAAALKTPVLCSNATAMKDFDFFAPLHINMKTQQNLTNSLAKFLNNKISTDVESISTHIKNKYSWDTPAIQLASILKLS